MPSKQADSSREAQEVAPSHTQVSQTKVTVEYDGNPGLDDQFIASLCPGSEMGNGNWESGAAEDALLQELPEDVREDAGRLMNSYEAEDDDEEDLVELDEVESKTSFDKQLKDTMQYQHDVIQGSRRPGAISTDRHCVKMIERFTAIALPQNHLQDAFIDEHFITLSLKHSSERERMTPQGLAIPGTRIGSAQLRKLFFGALRYRHQQVATIPELAAQKVQRPAASRQLTKFLKALMHQAVVNLRMGETEGEDAQDVRAGTILDRLTSEEEIRLGAGFLVHKNGMRGDVIRSMYLAAMQPYNMMLPLQSANVEVPGIILLQWTHKTGYTTSDQHPKFHTVITHKDPLYDAHTSFALYFHWLFDVYEIEEKHEFDWTLNKSWRRHKSSLQRQLMGKHHGEYGVAQSETERMGWASGVYAKHYANPIAKHDVLGSAGFSKVERYDPAEARGKQIQTAIDNGNTKIRGSLAFWKVIVCLRPRLFLGAAAIRQKYPDSALFRLPALVYPKVVEWMDKFHPKDLESLDKESQQVNLDNIQSEIVAEQLAGIHGRLLGLETKLANLCELLDRRTAVLLPSKGVDGVMYTTDNQSPFKTPTPNVASPCAARKGNQDSSPTLPSTPTHAPNRPSPNSQTQAIDSDLQLVSDLCSVHATAEEEERGIYLDQQGQTRAFAFPSPSKSTTTRKKTDLDPVLPSHLAWAPKGVKWESIFVYVKNPLVLWETWKPKAMGLYSTLQEVWADWDQPRIVENAGQKPPLKLVEGKWQSGWGRAGNAEKKRWSNYKFLVDFCKNRVEVQQWDWEQIEAFLESTKVPIETSKKGKKKDETQAMKPDDKKGSKKQEKQVTVVEQ
ncbi:hypothetical protein QFC20_002611 [Naganishia adeliensis]|uniref:Uncharacterized protein n=1 Tax=Naganishia adeliensis TaxID=92952 RepID=A0ACC2WJ06_9TREE|nr:hypothetical protein QFC20_002611 [Naganishia adeliensis]